MSLFGALYVGESGLRSSQNALNTVAHNLSNINTPGFVRQQVAQSDTTYTNLTRNGRGNAVQVGAGVKYSDCRHVRDAFLDAKYREESGRFSFYEVSYSTILEVESTMGEFDGAAFKDSLSGLWESMQEISKTPNDSTNLSLFVQSAYTFAENAMTIYQAFGEYQNNLNNQIKDAVGEINAIGARISALNKEISKIEAGGVEGANDLRDERDLLVDTLATYGNVSYNENSAGVMTVMFNGVDFVTDSRYFEMSMLTDKDTGFVTPYWKHNLIWTTDKDGKQVQDFKSAMVFDTTEEISTKRSTDIGSLRALLLARGDHVANYTDLTVGACTDAKLDALNITADEYNEAYGLKYYDEYISNSVMMNVQAEFDNLVHSIVTKINDVLAEACDPSSGYLCNEDGSPMQMFEKLETPGYEHVMLSSTQVKGLTKLEGSRNVYVDAQGGRYIPVCDENGYPIANNYWKLVEEKPNSPFSLYNCANLRTNQQLMQVPALLEFKLQDDSADYNIGERLVNAFEEQGIFLNPLATAMSDYENCYIDFMSQIGTSGNMYQFLYEYEELAVENADNERLTVIGVSQEEELEHMIMYHNAYNASSRYINVVNSLLDALIAMAS